MGKNPNRVLKPRTNLHKKVLAYTQHPEYTPKRISWFICYFNTDVKAMRETLDYLVFKRFLMKLPSGQYAVDRDVRPRITGTLCTVKDKFFILPDAGVMCNQIISVAPHYLLGACVGDHVRVALHLWDAEHENGILFGVVEEIIAPLSDRFCGELKQKGQDLFIIPDREWQSRGVQVKSYGILQDAGAFMYAEMINGDSRRKEALQAASLSQQKKTISARVLGDSFKKAESVRDILPQCCLVRQASPMRSERFLIEKRFTEELPSDAHREMSNVAKRGNYKRVEFCDRAVCMVNAQLAFHVEKSGTDYRLYVHVPDLTEDILPGSALDRAVRYKGVMTGLVPGEICERLSFGLKTKTRAFTVELCISRLGKISCAGFYRSRVVCTTRKATLVYSKIKKFLPRDCDKTPLVQKAAERALAVYFKEHNFEAPFLKEVRTKEESFCKIPQNTDRFCGAESETVSKADVLLDTVREQTVMHILDTNAEDAVCTPFGNPFDNYAAILTQQTMLFYLQKHRNKVEKEQFSAYLEDSLAVCFRQSMYRYEYKILKRKEDWMKKHAADGETEHRGTVLGVVPESDRSLPATAVYSDGNIIYCRNVPESVGVEDEIFFTATDTYKGTAMLVGNFCRKKDF